MIKVNHGKYCKLTVKPRKTISEKKVGRNCNPSITRPNELFESKYPLAMTDSISQKTI